VDKDERAAKLAARKATPAVQCVSGVAMGLDRVGKVAGPPECRGPEFKAKNCFNNFPVTVNIRTSGNTRMFHCNTPNWASCACG